MDDHWWYGQIKVQNSKVISDNIAKPMLLSIAGLMPLLLEAKAKWNE